MKVILQAGHTGRTSGGTGAPGEQKWNGEIVPKIASRLRDRGIEVKEVNADPKASEIAGDWDLFLAIHYDADIYNDRGGFIDTPDPSTDFANEESNRIANEMRKVYFSLTGIPERMNRSNKNTKFYYMWKHLSAKTPCVLIEAGVGWRTPEDHRTLHFEQDRVAGAISTGILNALLPESPVDQCNQYKDQITVLAKQKAVLEEANGKLSNANQKLKESLVSLQKQLDDLDCPILPSLEDDIDWVLNGMTEEYLIQGVKVTKNYRVKQTK